MADQYSAACQQFSLRHEPPETNEDCLYLNVFTPTNVSVVEFGELDESLPVLFWLHGGGYETGSAADLPQEACAQLAQRQLVLVTANYRLNYYGFFATPAPQPQGVPDNLGMFDQLRALHWVREEIGNFGGNSNLVTSGGHGAGAAAASLHTYSPLSKGKTTCPSLKHNVAEQKLHF